MELDLGKEVPLTQDLAKASPVERRPAKDLRIGAPYFNARPLVWEFIERPSPDLSLTEDVPTRLAAQVHSGELDAGLISSVEAYRDGSLEALTGIGVTARGPVWSIKLFHSKPLDAVRSVALDTSSYTSAALTRILLGERYGNHPEFLHMPPDLDSMLARCDAALLIGDPALRARHPDVPYADLGEEWFRWTGLPFVYAVWAARPGVFEEELSERLHAALEYGMTRLDAIVAAESGKRNLDPEVSRRYLGGIIRYRIGEDEQRGLERFLSEAAKYGLARPR
jgi:predicted solute-binding protein